MKVIFCYDKMNVDSIINLFVQLFELLKESIAVGIYTVVIAFFLSFIIYYPKNILFFLFILGFTKHFIGFWLQLQTLYCNYGETCKSNHDLNNQKQIWTALEPSFLENVGEGILFIMVGVFIKKVFSIHNVYFVSFFIGVLTHFIADLFGFHIYFCKRRCKNSFS